MTAITTPALSHLRALEAEAIHVMREVAAEREKPALLFSGGKDSIVLVRLAAEGVRAGPRPVPAAAHRHRPQLPRGDRVPRPARRRGRPASCSWAPCRPRSTAGRVREETGPRASRNRLQTVTLLDAIAEHGLDACFGGARRDEERSRAKERVLSPARRLRPVGPAPPAAGAVGPLQRARPPRRAPARVPDLELDRARRLAVHRLRGARAAVDLLRARPRGVRARRDALRGLAVRDADRRRGAVHGSPSATARSAT